MGLTYAEIELANAGEIYLAQKGYILPENVKKITVKALVDSGAYMLAINESIKLQLDLPKLEEQIAELADGSKLKLEIVGPVEVRFENRSTTCRAMVLPGDTEVLLGAIPLEDMDVLIDPRQQRLIVNPASPYFAKKSLK
ncbi:clan AA aspartic protease [Planktothrix agardhii 1032]|jgi:clan AA aspartic protease|uniref:clan AA aspartic protease n=1 Tax=Planktothrix agardhii TaxID=1160 RepID=UPI001D09A107|nr:clan AA aspartic protease [Planktothrix agardhii]MCB8776701.1 clan AA aspartic protease [Planktothrix agardhii 1031]MCF3599791.1 clan AA aspartic protease [Planktothrix agardhii 1032]MCP9295997.1 clan AA aspartic protease [Planktothrix agardhii LY1]